MKKKRKRRRTWELLWIWGVYFIGVGVLFGLEAVSGDSISLFAVYANNNSGMVTIDANSVITLLFFAIVFIIFLFATVHIHEGLRLSASLKKTALEIKRNSSEDCAKNFDMIKNKEDLFSDVHARMAFNEFKEELQKRDEAGINAKADIEDYINDDLVDRVISAHFLNQIAGAMTGLGILGTFVGLTLGLSSFNLTGNSEEIITQIQHLMEGIKVAFHTSIIGIIYSLGFNLLYKNYLARIEEGLDIFLDTFARYVIPRSDNGGISTTVMYQEKMIALLEKQIAMQEKQLLQLSEVVKKLCEGRDRNA